MYDIGLAVFKASVIGAPPKCEVCGAPSTLISKGRWFCSRACRRTASFDRQLRKEYGLPEAAYRGLLQIQSAACPICLKPLLEQARGPTSTTNTSPVGSAASFASPAICCLGGWATTRTAS